MYDHTDKLAQKTFEENIRLFTQPDQKPEQYNTYNGLAHLAVMIEELLQRVQSVEKQLAQVNQKLVDRSQNNIQITKP